MQPEPTNWLPGIIVLSVAFVLAAAWLLYMKMKTGSALPDTTPKTDGTVDDLAQRAQSLIEQLRTLEAEKHHFTAEHYTAEKARLEKEAAAALRAKDEHQKRQAAGVKAPARNVPAPTGWASRNPQMVGAMWGAGVVVFFGGLGYLLVSEQKPREEGQMGTGATPPGMAQQPMQQMPEVDDELEQARQRLASNPGDVEAASMLSHELIRQQQFDEALKVTLKGLAVDPFNVELRVHRGVLRAASQGDLQGAEAELTELVDTWPDAQEALIFLGSLSLRRGDKAGAIEHFERFTVEVPKNMQPPQLAPAIAQLKAEVAQQPQ
ncbi:MULTISPECIES: tetratricopeptide repeat protein [unclassified Corallococcus]|uniref:tetratricopeptide repeat protein n=1 Tax=unclassified Corallococcus TaxID=2685029 RepID=UPI001A8DF8A7|nr:MULTISPECIES: tetratricopeptide repeat protein [unclassified Corallococcus]MBN9686322.1 tetratricopeptide repeat protein [Corallococcus sp. NCSPR001]WAS82249.1 tetratricopeptide repeat protein [Corallococcus sp. NCRR]